MCLGCGIFRRISLKFAGYFPGAAGQEISVFACVFYEGQEKHNANLWFFDGEFVVIRWL
jgi:hypothetical protein